MPTDPQVSSTHAKSDKPPNTMEKNVETAAQNALMDKVNVFEEICVYLEQVVALPERRVNENRELTKAMQWTCHKHAHESRDKPNEANWYYAERDHCGDMIRLIRQQFVDMGGFFMSKKELEGELTNLISPLLKEMVREVQDARTVAVADADEQSKEPKRLQGRLMELLTRPGFMFFHEDNQEWQPVEQKAAADNENQHKRQ